MSRTGPRPYREAVQRSAEQLIPSSRRLISAVVNARVASKSESITSPNRSTRTLIRPLWSHNQTHRTLALSSTGISSRDRRSIAVTIWPRRFTKPLDDITGQRNRSRRHRENCLLNVIDIDGEVESTGIEGPVLANVHSWRCPPNSARAKSMPAEWATASMSTTSRLVRDHHASQRTGLLSGLYRLLFGSRIRPGCDAPSIPRGGRPLNARPRRPIRTFDLPEAVAFKRKQVDQLIAIGNHDL